MIKINNTPYYYLDNAATTFLDPEVEEEMKPWLSCANPHSHHCLGEQAYKAVEKARAKIALYIGAESSEDIIFVSGASEANNMVGKCFRGKDYSYCVTSEIEHHSMMRAMSDATMIKTTSEGKIDFANFQYPKRVDLSCTTWVNNITGVKQLVPTNILSNDAYIHMDGTQALGKFNFAVADRGIDSMSCSAHKIHGPKGIGFLYANKRMRSQLKPLISGGSQENNLRAGTLNVAGIVGMAKAVELAYENLDANNDWLYKVHDYFREKLLASSLDYEFIVDPDKQLPSHMNVAFHGIRGEQLMSRLSNYGICVSTGSACDSDDNTPNYVLTAMGIDPELIESSIRFSFSKDTELADIHYTMEVLETILPLMK